MIETDTVVRAHGKFLWLNAAKWHVRGLTYGPFARNSEGEYLPERSQRLADFAHMRTLGANSIRLYHLPSRHLVDDAMESGLRVFVDVPWEKHRCFLEDWSAQTDARKRVRDTARGLGRHPGVFAISVANEIPIDVVRFHGATRIERFLNELLDVAKQEAPECLVTYTNYPSTEFLAPDRLDFHCANVYVNDIEGLGNYLDRLQHVAGNLPLVLGEHGMDSVRQTERGQASALAGQLRTVARRGLAGSFVFSYTDDWFTGGHQIEDWGFGVTDRTRAEKPAAARLRRAWSPTRPETAPVPRVSVVVCSYNGSRTLRECLTSLGGLNYPDYEVILVDDGSTDSTPEIAADFPSVRYMGQRNYGLSVARNRGAIAATGEIVAYTDDDCVADPDWLKYLVQAMQDQKVDAIGGPNIPPPSDSWTARCVAASPGGPSHVMLDDRRAEHVPGCNMAFKRDKLLGIGGFDPRYRVAGDDVDICWRFQDAHLTIGYASAALVWHHRRTSARAYLKQQRGYGRAEAMLHFKHPDRVNRLGFVRWNGIIYGEGAVGLPVAEPAVYHGRFGTGLFQIAYHRNDYRAEAYFTLLHWHVLALLVLSLGIVWPAAVMISAAMWCLTLGTALRAAIHAPLPTNAPLWCRPLVFLFNIVQPVARAAARYNYRLRMKRLPDIALEREDASVIDQHLKRTGPSQHDLYWTSNRNIGRAELLHSVVQSAAEHSWDGNFGSEWDDNDVELVGDRWNSITIRSATEELGWPNRFTRARFMLRPTQLTWFASGTGFLFAGEAAARFGVAGAVAGSLALAALSVRVLMSRARCRHTVAALLWQAGIAAGLEPVPVRTKTRFAEGAPDMRLAASP